MVVTGRTNLKCAVVATGLVFGGWLIGCAAHQSMALERARTSYEVAERDPVVAANGKPELAQAHEALQQAQDAFDDDDASEKVDHLALLAEKQVDIAKAKANQRASETTASILGQERSDLVAHQVAVAQELQARETARGLVVTLGDVLFESGKATLKPTASNTLLELVSMLRDQPDRQVLIEGHTDSQGGHSYNVELSDRRADAVRAFMIAHGVAPERIVATGYGEAYPVASNATREGRAMNRRVEVVLLKPGDTPRLGSVTLR